MVLISMHWSKSTRAKCPAYADRNFSWMARLKSKNHKASPSYVLGSALSNRFVVGQLSKRGIYGRYRGTLLGLVWSFITPLLMLGIYTFVFGAILQIKWPDQGGGSLEFAAILFSGMLIHSLFAECLTKAPTLILANPQYVKKMIFPLESLVWVSLATAVFQAVISVVILIFYLLLVGRDITWTVLLFPIPLAGLCLFCIGVGWLVSAIGVFVKDIAQVTGLFSTVLFFMAPILYPKTALPEQIQTFLYLNPITFPIEQFRVLVLWGQQPDWIGLGIYFSVAFIFAWVTLAWFQKVRTGFADVL